MLNIIKSVINAGGYKLADVQHKIKKLYILGDLTEEQMDELLAMASQGANANAERPETLQMIKQLSDKLDALEARVADLEGTEEEESPEDPEASTYPAWEPWDGISDKYQKDAIVTHIGQIWISEFNGQNVWEPGAVGTEAMWILYEAAEA